MNQATLLVNRLLEDDADDSLDPRDYLAADADQLDQEKASGAVTPRTALTAQHFWHRTARYSDGIRALEVRRNGATKTWKNRPNAFRIPVKFGFKQCLYIDNDNASQWSTKPVPDLPGKPKIKPFSRLTNPNQPPPPV